MRDFKVVLLTSFVIYMFLIVGSFFVGISDSGYRFVGSCRKNPTLIGYYTGISIVYDLGCKAGQRVNK